MLSTIDPANKTAISGIYVPTLVPLDSHGEIHESTLRQFISWLIEKGVHGLYPNGSTGEFTRFTSEERKLIVRIVCEEARGRVPVLAGAAEANVRETLHACETYAGYGARAVAIVAPYYNSLSPESVYAYFKEIALHSPIDVTLYNIPMFASPINLDTITRLAEFERIIGIKDSSGDVAFMMRMIAAIRHMRPNFVFLTGWDPVLVPMLVAGADGGTHASGNVVPEVTQRIYELVRAGKLDEAMKLQQRLLALFDAMLDPFEFPDGFRAGMELRGFDFGRSRQPQTEAQSRARDRLKTSVLQVLSGFGLPD